jgi:micrococcal nuclease
LFEIRCTQLVILLLFTIQAHAQTYKVIGIIDGDTYDILVDNKPVRIRMEGIDAPERGMPYNKKAKQYLANMVFGKMITVVEKEKDRNGRSVSSTYLADGTDVSLAMIKVGFAWHYKKYPTNNTYAAEEIIARKKKIGLWAEPNPLPPWEVRKLHRSGVSTKELFENSVK